MAGLFPDLLTIVECATILVTFIMMGSGIPLCSNMYKTKNTTNVPYSLFLVSIFLTTLGLQYGIKVNSKLMLFLNVVGLAVWGTFIGVYILVSRSKSKSLLQLLGVAALYYAHLYYLYSLPEKDQTSTFGRYMLFWTFIINVLPALEIITMVKDKSTDCCDLPMFSGGTLSAATWGLYGYLINDVYIYLPSLPGLIVSSIKFTLMLVYGFPSNNSEAKQSSSKTKVGGQENNNVTNNKARETLRQRKMI